MTVAGVSARGCRAVLLLLLLLAGCAGRLTPPAEVRDPVTVYLLDHGRHASLVVPCCEGGVVRYSYGDWQWYVEGRRHLLSAIGALLWPTPGALGRRAHEELAAPEELGRVAPEGIARIYPLRVERSRVVGFRRRLDSHFRAGQGVVDSAEFDLAFVRYPRAYWLVHQSNLVVADWLDELGVTVQGFPWLSRWRVTRPALKE